MRTCVLDVSWNVWVADRGMVPGCYLPAGDVLRESCFYLVRHCATGPYLSASAALLEISESLDGVVSEKTSESIQTTHHDESNR